MVPPGALTRFETRRTWLAAGLAAAAGLPLAALSLTAAAVLAGVAILVAAAIRPQICLYLAAFAVPFGDLRTVTIGGLSTGALDASVALLLVTWAAHSVAQRRLIVQLPPLFWPLAVLFGALCLSLFDAVDLRAGAKELAKWGEAILVYVAGASLLTTRRQQAILAACLLGAGTAEALIGAYGSVMRIGPPSYAILGGLLYRASGDFAQPNPFAGYMNQTWPLALGLLLAAASTRGRAATLRQPRVNWALAACAVLSTAALLLSWSRGAWLGAGVALAAMALSWTAALAASPEARDRASGRRAVALLLVVATLLAVLAALGAGNLLPSAVTARIGSIGEDLAIVQQIQTVRVNDANFSTVERVAHWLAGWRMWEAHPWAGVGAGNYAVAYPEYRLAGWDDPLGHAHNYYINIGAEAGTIGLAAYLLFLLAALAVTCRRLIRASTAWERGLALGVLGALLARIAQDGLDNLWVHGMTVQAALLLLLLETPDRAGRGARTKPVPQERPAARPMPLPE